jgi:hypothetical protein
MEHLEHRICAQKQNVLSGSTRGMPEGGGEKRFSDADGSEKDDVFEPVDKAESKEVADAITVEGNGSIPVESFEGLLFLKAGFAKPGVEIFVLTPVDFVLQHELEKIKRR